MPKHLLAKSYSAKEFPGGPPRFALLQEHTRDVVACCKVLFDSVGKDACVALGIPFEREEPLRLALVANGYCQDLGKGNSVFLRLVTTEPKVEQLLRHEHVSGLVLWTHEPLRQWMSPLDETLRLYALWGAMGHHRKFHVDTRPKTGKLHVHLSHPAFAEILREMARDVGLSSPPTLTADITLVDFQPDAAKGEVRAAAVLNKVRSDFCEMEEAFRGNEIAQRELALVKGLGIAADVAASALGRAAASSADVANHATQLLSTTLSAGDIEGLIVDWAWKTVEAERPEFCNERPSDFKIRDFQEQVGASASMLTLAEAGCGSGKSLAAYLWAKQWGERRASDGRSFRLFFCLPTTGTTTEHYKDYAIEMGVNAALAHSRAAVDLNFMAETEASEELSEKEADTTRAAQEALAAMRVKIDALALWSTPLVVCTTDTVLGLMANARKSVCSLPAILQSGIVFDEIHSFDETLFGHLLSFLKHFRGIPVLLMTASLPEARRKALKAVREDLVCIPGPEELELRRRHIIRTFEGEPWEEIEKALHKNERVLWVCNQVDRASNRWREAKRFSEFADVLLYHSRYRYKDRTRVHRRVLDRFKSAQRGVLLVATQVAEMSLDLSADLLVTDIAPVPSLIQRLGRHRRKNDGQAPGLVLVCSVPNGEEAPYTKGEFASARRWLDRLPRGEGVHQRALNDAFAALEEDKAVSLNEAARRCGFFGYLGEEGFWRTAPGVTRTDGYTVSVVFPDDYEEWERTLKKHRDEPSAEWMREHEVSVPVRKGMEQWKRIGTALLAEKPLVYDFDEKRCEGRGARWEQR